MPVTPDAPQGKPTLNRRLLIRPVWLILVVVCTLGLRNYRVDNDISRWTPGLKSSFNGQFILIGFDRSDPRAESWSHVLGAQPAIASLLPIPGDGVMDGLLAVSRDGIAGAELLTVVRDALADDIDAVALAGPPVFSDALNRWSQVGLNTASGLILVLGAAVMWLTTRRWRSVLESLFAVFSAQVVLVGLMAITGTPMDMVLSMTPPLLLGLGFSFAAHRATRSGVNRALLLSMATTAISLALFVFTDFQPIRAFAVWSASGVVLTWSGVMCLVTPPTMHESKRSEPPAEDPTIAHRRGLAWAVVVTAALITIGGFLTLPRLNLQEDTLAYFPADARIVRDYRRIEAELTGTMPFEVIVDRPDADPTAVVRETPGVRRFRRGLSITGARQAVYFGLAGNDAVESLSDAQTHWQAWARSHGARLQWKGVAAQLDHVSRSVWRTACWALPTMFIVAAIAAWLVDKRPSAWLLSLWVNAFPVAVLGGWLWLSGKPVGLPSLLISALAVGIAIDDTLHLLYARKTYGSFTLAVRICRRACLGSSIVTAACMLTFLLCPFRPTAEFGFLVALSVIAAAVGDLVLLPAAANIFSSDAAVEPTTTHHVHG